MNKVFNRNGLRIVQTESLLSVFCQDELIVEAKIGGKTARPVNNRWGGYVEYNSSQGRFQFTVDLTSPESEKCYFEHGEGKREHRAPSRFEEASRTPTLTSRVR